MCFSSNPVVKARKEVVKGVWQCVVCGVGGCVAVLVASQSLYPLPHASGVVAVEVILCCCLFLHLASLMPLLRLCRACL